MATKDLTPQLMKGEVWSVNGQRGAVTLPEPVNSLDSDSTTAPLAAAQGKALKGIADGAVSTANAAKAGLDSKADKASNNFTTSLQLKGDDVATENYVKTADVSGTKIDGKTIKTYIADAIKAGSGNTRGLVGTLGAINSVAFIGARDNLDVGSSISSVKYAGFSGTSTSVGSYLSSNLAPGTWRILGYGPQRDTKHNASTLGVRIS